MDIRGRIFGFLGVAGIVAGLALLAPVHSASADDQTVGQPPAGQPAGPSSGYTADEIVAQGHRIFGDVSQGLAAIVERSVSQYGLPNGYIVGQEGAGSIIVGARYGEGMLYTKNAGEFKVYWQGPSIGFDIGGNGDRVMMLVYNLPSVDALYQRYVGVDGSAFVVAGLGMTVLSRDGVYIVPIVSGVGARIGVSFGYLKFSQQPTWNPL